MTERNIPLFNDELNSGHCHEHCKFKKNIGYIFLAKFVFNNFPHSDFSGLYATAII
jgi:hypothetical protein